VSTSRLRKNIDAIVADIERTRRSLLDRGMTLRDISDDGDREAREIIARLQRRLQRQRRREVAR